MQRDERLCNGMNGYATGWWTVMQRDDRLRNRAELSIIAMGSLASQTLYQIATLGRGLVTLPLRTSSNGM